MLTLEGVYKSFGGGGRRGQRGRLVAVDGLSLAIGRGPMDHNQPGEGEVFGLLGPNGAGKTTTIAMAAGLLRPDRGVVRLGRSGIPAEARVRGLLGVAPQELALYGALTARENLVFFARLQGLDRRSARRRADELLELVGLAERADRRVGGLSGGMRRRLNLACALVGEPAIVLLDEPTAGVDPHSRHAIFGLIRRLRARGVTVLFSTHYMEEAARLCDRVAVIDRGRLLALGSVDELVRAHGGHSAVVYRLAGETRERRVRTDRPMEAIARLLEPARAAAVQAAAATGSLGEPHTHPEADTVAGAVAGVVGGGGGGVVEELRVERPDLESVFLNLTGRGSRD